MMRFIDIRDGVYPGDKDCTQFSWWDTITDSFVEFNGEQMWDSWDEFEKDVRDEDLENYNYYCVTEEILARFKGLYPKGKK